MKSTASVPIVGLKRSSPNDITWNPEQPSKIHEIGTIHEHDDEHDELNLSKFMSDFDILTIIGNGSFGTVYRVKSKKDQQLYAIKRSRRQFRNNVDKHQMLNEVEALSELTTNESEEAISTIVKYYIGWIEDDYVCIQMELCDASVEAMIAQSYVFTEPDVYIILQDILLALRALHR